MNPSGPSVCTLGLGVRTGGQLGPCVLAHVVWENRMDFRRWPGKCQRLMMHDCAIHLRGGSVPSVQLRCGRKCTKVVGGRFRASDLEMCRPIDESTRRDVVYVAVIERGLS